MGRVDVAEDNSPLPRDRFIFNYDHFGGVALTPQGISVNRYVLGFEKTFHGGRSSVEVRAPFASTLSSTSTLGSDERGTEFGNVLTTFKYALLNEQYITASVGVGVTLPTASGTRLNDVDGNTLLAIPNRAISVTPFAALLHTPNDRVFWQAWGAVDIDTNGTAVYVNPLLTGLDNARVGKLRETNVLLLDFQLGYWLVRQDYGALQGFAPFVELHSTSNIGDGGFASAGDVFVGRETSHLRELNMTFGFITQLGPKLVTTTGLVVPLKGDENKTFDYQLGFRASCFFGPTVRNRGVASPISTF